MSVTLLWAFRTLDNPASFKDCNSSTWIYGVNLCVCVCVYFLKCSFFAIILISGVATPGPTWAWPG